MINIGLNYAMWQLLLNWLPCVIGCIGLCQFVVGNKNGLRVFFQSVSVLVLIRVLPLVLSVIHVGIANIY